jgi:hypothetical protein
MKSFAASLDAFADKTVAQMRAVMQESVQEVVATAQTPKAQGGRMPVDTGFLRNSLASGVNGAFGAPAPESYELTIAGMEIGDVARFAWTANYAMYQELGTSKMHGNHFVGAAAAEWPQIVERNAARVKS